MLNKIILFIVVAGIGIYGCGKDEEERKELVSYVKKLAVLGNSNGEVVKWIETLDDPSFQMQPEDLQQARDLIAEYVGKLGEIDPATLSYRELRVTHNLYLTKMQDAIRLAADQGRVLKRERGNVAIGVRHIEKLTKLHYGALDLLWSRQKIVDPLLLEWSK
ncbi:MAG: hypothetical protein VX294_00140 [Candidatus Latescibacterota bacterium]|nr:hypothetical protein [Candidatus Latescibacterota bacterium]